MTTDEIADRILAEHEARLTVGQRVRIMPGEGCHQHGEQEAGITGTIIAAEFRKGFTALHPTHRYLVLFDRPLWITRSSIATWEYCAAELAPIPWPTPEEVVADTLRRECTEVVPRNLHKLT